MNKPSFERCPRCKQYCWDAVCRCKRFRAGIPWKGKLEAEEMDEIFAKDAEDAAENYAEDRDRNGDYTIIRNGEAEVWVFDEEDVLTKWGIEAYQEPVYRAHQIATPTSGEVGK